MNSSNKVRTQEDSFLKFCWVKTCCPQKSEQQTNIIKNRIMSNQANIEKSNQKIQPQIKILTSFLKNKFNPHLIKHSPNRLNENLPKSIELKRQSKNINQLKQKQKPFGVNLHFKPMKDLYKKKRTNTSNNISPKGNLKNFSLSKQNYKKKQKDIIHKFELPSTMKHSYNQIGESDLISTKLVSSENSKQFSNLNHSFSPVRDSKQKKVLNPEPGLTLGIKPQNLTPSRLKSFYVISPKQKMKISNIRLKKDQQQIQNLSVGKGNSIKNKIINFRDMRTILSQNETINSKLSFMEKSQVLYRNAGKLDYLQIHQLNQKSEDTKLISDFMKKQSNPRLFQSTYQHILFNEKNQLFPKITDVDILNQSFNFHKKQDIDFNIDYYFNKGSFIGIGRFSTVYIAEQKNLGYLVAMKQILKSTIQNNNLQHQLQRQMIIHNKVHNENIVQLYTVFHDAKKFYLIMELGQTTLRKVLKQRTKLPQKQAIKYLKDIINGLSYLHANNIIHRDIKPQNIIIINNICKIVDFGWAVEFNQLRNSLCGTSDYASPQMLGLIPYNFKLDSWAVGIIAYQLVYGKLPFNTHYIQQFHLEFDADIEISKKYKNLLIQLLQIQEHNRLGMNEALSHECFYE